MIDKYLNKLSEQENSKDVQTAIINFFKKNKKPSDDQIHGLASELNMNPHRFEEEVYNLLGSLVGGVGRHQDSPDDKFDPKELKMGIDVEKEHTDSPAIAKEIAKDHLAECSTYYSRLAKMENECKKAKGNGM